MHAQTTHCDSHRGIGTNLSSVCVQTSRTVGSWVEQVDHAFLTGGTRFLQKWCKWQKGHAGLIMHVHF